MRAFWATIGILMLALAGYLLIGRNGAPEQVTRPGPEQRKERTAARPAPQAPILTPQVETPPQESPAIEPIPAPALGDTDAATVDAPEPSPASEPPQAVEAPPQVAEDPPAPAAPVDARAIIAQWQQDRGNPDWPRVQRLWMAEVHAEVQRTALLEEDPRAIALAAVRRETEWRSTFLEITRDRVRETLNQQGLDAAAIAAMETEFMQAIEESIVESVLAGVVARREAASNEPSPGLPPASPEIETVESPLTEPEPPLGPAVVEDDAGTAEPGEWLVHREDGSMIADNRYIIRGKGTIEEPYKVSWEHLISAEEEYVPREGRTEIPKRIQMLHDKHVEITGYVAFPLLMDAADELLVMLNQWDGCCLGVPPTPYDAVEVQLQNLVTGNATMTSYGTVTGTFKVEPHLVGGWLVGLYLIEGASLKPLAYGGFAP